MSGEDEPRDWAALAAYIEKRRTALGLSVEEAAALAKTSDTAWRELEKGRRRVKSGEVVEPNPRRNRLAKVAAALQVSVDDLEAILAGQAPTQLALSDSDRLARLEAAVSDLADAVAALERDRPVQ